MIDDADPPSARLRHLVDEYRTTCLWYLREDYYPETAEEVLRVLDAISRHGDVTAFRKAAALRPWFSRTSSSPSVA